jgi:hypothetical protein
LAAFQQLFSFLCLCPGGLRCFVRLHRPGRRADRSSPMQQPRSQQPMAAPGAAPMLRSGSAARRAKFGSSQPSQGRGGRIGCCDAGLGCGAAAPSCQHADLELLRAAHPQPEVALPPLAAGASARNRSRVFLG